MLLRDLLTPFLVIFRCLQLNFDLFIHKFSLRCHARLFTYGRDGLLGSTFLSNGLARGLGFGGTCAHITIRIAITVGAGSPALRITGITLGSPLGSLP